MAIYETLLLQQESLAALYNSNLQTVLALQRTLIEEILPGLVDELGLNEEDEQRARQFLEDTSEWKVFSAYNQVNVEYFSFYISYSKGRLALISLSESDSHVNLAAA